MARKLKFHVDTRSFECTMVKLDRAKLYGRKEVDVEGVDGQPLRKGYLDEWGTVVIEATGMGYLDEEKQWHGRNELVAVDESGEPLQLLASTFDKPVVLRDTTPLETFFEYEIDAVYLLGSDEIEDLIAYLNFEKGLYTFDFVYRSGYQAKTAFLNPVGGQVFMLIGTRTNLVFLSKPERTEIEDFEEEELDFSMM